MNDATVSVQNARVRLNPVQTAPGLTLKRTSKSAALAVRNVDVDTSSVNAIDVHVLADRTVWMCAQLLRDGAPIAATRWERFPPSPVAFHFQAPFEWPLPTDSADQLALRFNGDARVVVLLDVQLLDRPSALLAAESRAGQLVRHDGRAGRGVWLSTDRVHSAQWMLDPRGELTFDFLQPHDARRRNEQAALRVELEDSHGHRLEREFALPGGSDAPSTWEAVRVPLAGFASGPAQVRAHLVSDVDSTCVLANLATVVPDERRRPCVLLVTSDTHRADHVRASSTHVDLQTPELDRLAARGVLFENCVAPTNSTNPSHAALMTGMHPRDVNILNNLTALTSAAPTLAGAFRDQGYRTVSCIGVEHLSDRVTGLGSGFDTALTPPLYGRRTASETVDAALAELEKLGDEPVFLWVHVFDAHTPYAPPAPFDRMYYDNARDPFDPTAPELDLPDNALAPELRGLRDLEFPRAQYRASVSYLDHELGRLFNDQRFAHGVAAFVGDHGELLGEHGVYFDHAGLYPQTVHVPLVAAWPGAPAGLRCEARVQHIDLGRTLLSLAGAENVTFPGADLRTRLVGSALDDSPRFQLSAHAASAAIDTPTHCLILSLTGVGDPRVATEREIHRCTLYDLRSDPGCEHDVLNEQFDVARALRGQLIGWLGQRRSLGWAGATQRDPHFVEQLRSLGYVDVERDEEAPLWTDDDCEWCRRFR